MGCTGAGKGGGVLVWGAEVVSINLSIFFFVERNKMFFSTVADKQPPHEQGRADLGAIWQPGGTRALPQGSAPGGLLSSSSGI